DSGVSYKYVQVRIDRDKRLADWTVCAPESATPQDVDGIVAQGDAWWPLQLARELDDAILHMRSNELEIGTWVFKTRGDAALVLEADHVMQQHGKHWLVRETLGLLRRTLARLDVSSRSMFALMDEGSCF